MTQYSLATSYVGQGLLNGFSFFTGADPSHGFVNYQSQANAVAKGLVSVAQSGAVRLGVDSRNTYSVKDAGRPSVRLTSYAGYTHGLFIADFQHMPASTCGVWPAFWAFNNYKNGVNWPNGGELDIVEGVNTAQKNLFSAHTTAGCVSPKSGFTGKQGPTSCGPTSDNVGCNYGTPNSDTSSYGDTFNAAGGGVYAMQWETDGIKMWHFPRSSIPANIKTSAPDPSTWGLPDALFGGSTCNTDSYFFNMSLVININFCGDYAGSVWGVQDKCNNLAANCATYVAGNPGAFSQSYWNINYIKVFQRPPIKPATRIGRAVSEEHEAKEPIPAVASPEKALVNREAVVTETITLSRVHPSAMPTQSSGGLSDASINGYSPLGCLGSSSGYTTWSAAADLPNMDNELCVASCAGHKYAGVYNTTCFCADTLGDTSTVDIHRCDLPCVGNSAETCGGIFHSHDCHKATHSNSTKEGPVAAMARLHGYHHTSPADIFLTVFGKVASESGPEGYPVSTATPAVYEAAKVTTAVTVTYSTVCATNAAQLIQVAYGTTLTLEQSKAATSKGAGSITAASTAALTRPLVPMTTRTQTCDGCGPKGESTVTLTVPKAVLTASADVVVTAFAKATVVPIDTKATVLPVAANGTKFQAPAKAGATREGLRLGGVIGWGILIWLGFFGATMGL